MDALKRAIAAAIHVRLDAHPPPYAAANSLAWKVYARGQYGVELRVTTPAGVVRRFVVSVREELPKRGRR